MFKTMLICLMSASMLYGAICVPPGGYTVAGECIGGSNNGALCTDPSQCDSGDCSYVPPSNICDGGINDGQDCVTDADCPDAINPGIIMYIMDE